MTDAAHSGSIALLRGPRWAEGLSSTDFSCRCSLFPVLTIFPGGFGVLGIGSGKMMTAEPGGNKEEILVLLGIKSSENRSATGITNRPRWKACVPICVVG